MADGEENTLATGAFLRSGTLLRAGALTVRYDSGGIRYVKLGDELVLLRVYVAVRDHHWNTIPARITVLETLLGADAFEIRFEADHHEGEVHFRWQGTFSGSSDGTLVLKMDGEALSNFLRNRIGFCVLHPMACAGAPCTVEHVDGTMTNGAFPLKIAPHQPFVNMRAIRHEVTPGVQAEVRFSGDTFEMEDQRNWTDASYKTYSTPLALPMPVLVSVGTRIKQAVTLRLIGDVKPIEVREPEAVQLTVDTGTVVGRLARLGLRAAGHEQPLTVQEIERLRLLKLAHLRADVYFDQPDWEARLRQTIGEAQALDVALEIALHVGDGVGAGAQDGLLALRRIVDERTPAVAAWLVLDGSGQGTTPPEAVALARRHLESYATDARFAGGTDGYFTQLNRVRPSLDGLDLLSYSLNPQVHAFDDASLVESLATQAVILDSGREFSGGRGLMVCPVTLKMRANPERAQPVVDRLPIQVDPRQRALFGAGWTLGSIKYLSEGGAESATYYETTGWLGVMEREEVTSSFAEFPSKSGEVFPLFHVLADVGEMAGAAIYSAVSDEALRIDGLMIGRGDRQRILIANYSPAPETVMLTGIEGEGTLRRLDAGSIEQARYAPQAFRESTGGVINVYNGLKLELAPHAVMRIDFSSTH